MSDYGLRIKNTSGKIQIDSTYRNYVLEKSGSLDLGGGSLTSISITNNPNPPVVLIRPTDATNKACGVFDITYSSPNYTAVRFFGGGVFDVSTETSASGTCTFDYKIFTLSESKSTEDYGLRIYNTSEKLVYDSGYTPLKILEVGNATYGSTYTHASHTNPYYIASPKHSGAFSRLAGGTQSIFRFSLALAKQSSTSVRGEWVILGATGTGHGGVYAYSGLNFTLLVCE